MHYLLAKLTCLLLPALLLGACASQVPLAIREAPPGSPSLEVVRAQPGDYLGQPVRWGGALIETGNQESVTRLIVLGRPLDSAGEPELTDNSAGRFIVIVPAFLDPKVYAPDRRITVRGTLARIETGKVGDYPYSYPVVEAQAWHLWPVETMRRYDYDYPYPGWYDPWYYRPWYGPWYPYGYPYHPWY